jgi:hypothetical protein
MLARQLFATTHPCPPSTACPAATPAEALALLTATDDQAALLMETEGSLPLQEGPGMAAGQQAGGPADSQDVTRMTDDHMVRGDMRLHRCLAKPQLI